MILKKTTDSVYAANDEKGPLKQKWGFGETCILPSGACSLPIFKDFWDEIGQDSKWLIFF